MSHSLETVFVRGGERPDYLTGALAPVLYRSKTYAQNFGEKAEFEYSRGNNPTRNVLEEKLAALEGGGKATVFSSGLAAETMLFLNLEPGDHIIIPKEVYGGTTRLLRQVFAQYGITYSSCDFSSEDSIARKVQKNTRYLFVEALTNPFLTPIDLSLVQRFSEKRGIPFIADMTFCPPCTTQAFDYNAYAIIHSLSKYLSGHNDVLGGAIITKDEKLHQRLHLLQKTIGAVLSPDECYRTIQGIKTLHLRWKRVSENAEQVASYLSQHPKVKKVWYPSLHKEHESFLSQQFKKGYGGVVSFELLERLSHPVSSFVAGVQESKVITYAESLASPETLLAYPYTMSHGSLSAEEKQALGITEHFFRLSVGFEGAEDIISSLKNGLRFV